MFENFALKLDKELLVCLIVMFLTCSSAFDEGWYNDMGNLKDLQFFQVDPDL